VAKLICSADGPETCLGHERIRSGGSVWALIQVALAQWNQKCIRKMWHLYNTHTADSLGNRKASGSAEFKMILLKALEKAEKKSRSPTGPCFAHLLHPDLTLLCPGQPPKFPSPSSCLLGTMVICVTATSQGGQGGDNHFMEHLLCAHTPPFGAQSSSCGLQL